jgi:hypothetical protein
MDDHDDFFGDIFEDPEDDPLLDGDADDEPAPGGPSSSRGRTPGRGIPSWITEDSDPERPGGPASTDAPGGPSSPTGDGGSGEPGAAERREIVVDQRAGRGLEALNEAVAQGWRLIRISLARTEESAAEQQAAERFVAILELDTPQSLFDFGPGS